MESEPIQAVTGGTARPDFSLSVPNDGYRWWYVDGVSGDGQHAFVIIAFVGSVFSPYYYRARQRGRGNPENYCAINVALYSKNQSRWCMTERDRPALVRDRELFQVGRSRIQSDGENLVINIDERSMPFLRRVRGTIHVRPTLSNSQAFALDRRGSHLWQPIAPSADVSVEFSTPALVWKGSGYVDTNAGARPLEKDFRSWSWSRGEEADGVDIRYNVLGRDNVQRGTHFLFAPNDGYSQKSPCQSKELPRGLWRVRRDAYTDRMPAEVSDLEDTPFYTRSLLKSPDEPPVMHEFLDMQRFEKPWVRALLPFRMPRRHWKV